ncbi:MAG: ATP-grasp domain-containing protein [Alphaproteobacteria bacterium]
MKRLLLLVPTTSYRTADFLDAARRLELDVVVGSNRRSVLERHAEGRTLTLNFRHLERGRRQIVRYARERPLDAIVAVDDAPVMLAAVASAALGLPHDAIDAVAATRDKHVFRTRLVDAGLPSPPFRLAAVDDDPAQANGNVGYPCVVKPLGLSGSRGVIRADDPAGFAAAFRRVGRLLARPGIARMGENSRHILVEGYIPGVEIALEGLLADGKLHVLALFDKPDPLEGPFFEETIYVTPSRLAPTAQAAVVAAAERALCAVGLRHGPVHAELRLNEAGPWVIEVAARSIGGLCSRVLRFGAGIRLEELILCHALGEPIEAVERERRPAGVMMIPIPRAGTLRAVEGIDAARAVPGIEDVVITVPKGQKLVPLPEGDRYLGFLFARHDSPAAVEAALRAAHARLDIQVSP